jgi:5-(carboxyamino)imidazole ribonucleotide mutase
MQKNDYFVAILMGSDSDLDVMKNTVDVLDSFGIPREVRITSAHRTPAETHQYVKEADERGCAVFIAAAGLAAHLAGTLAGITTKPVIGVPMDGGNLGGMDALLSTVQMPAGIPVACVAIGKAGARNAGYLAAQIIASADESIAKKLVDERAENAKKVMQKNELLTEINQKSS